MNVSIYFSDILRTSLPPPPFNISLVCILTLILCSGLGETLARWQEARTDQVGAEGTQNIYAEGSAGSKALARLE